VLVHIEIYFKGRVPLATIKKESEEPMDKLTASSRASSLRQEKEKVC